MSVCPIIAPLLLYSLGVEGLLGVVCSFLAAGGEKDPILLCLVVRTDAMS